MYICFILDFFKCTVDKAILSANFTFWIMFISFMFAVLKVECLDFPADPVQSGI